PSWPRGSGAPHSSPTRRSSDLGRPALLDEVMVHFPELRVCAAPPGFPWVHELIGAAWRHANVHIGLVAIRPKYLAVAGSGYEPLDRKSTRVNSSHVKISYAVFC